MAPPVEALPYCITLMVASFMYAVQLLLSFLALGMAIAFFLAAEEGRKAGLPLASAYALASFFFFSAPLQGFLWLWLRRDRGFYRLCRIPYVPAHSSQTETDVDMVLLIFWCSLLSFGSLTSAMTYIDPPFNCLPPDKDSLASFNGPPYGVCPKIGAWPNFYCGANIILQIFYLLCLRRDVTWPLIRGTCIGLFGMPSMIMNSWRRRERRNMEAGTGGSGRMNGARVVYGRNDPTTFGMYNVSRV